MGQGAASLSPTDRALHGESPRSPGDLGRFGEMLTPVPGKASRAEVQPSGENLTRDWSWGVYCWSAVTAHCDHSSWRRVTSPAEHHGGETPSLVSWVESSPAGSGHWG